MATRILAIGTALPASRLDQAETRDFFASQDGVDRLAARLIRAAFDHSAIECRYSVIGTTGRWSPIFVNDDRLRSPSTSERNAVYRAEAPPLFAEAARDALTRAACDASKITHVVTVSCTGFFAPGPDFLLLRELGVPLTAERYHVGFMGCAAAFPALRMAASFCDSQPESVVLVVCAELCSIHIRSSPDPEQIVAASVFADGAAAAVVSAKEPLGPASALSIDGFTTAVTEEGEGDMDWTIGDQGFEMRLTPEVPRIIGREISNTIDRMLDTAAVSRSEITAWAVHPGGRSVLDRVQNGLELSDEAMKHSRAVLREYGNMSSATILFILDRLLNDDSLADGARLASVCFGPGLTVETALFTRRLDSHSSEPRA